jgi:hypothetical protein
MSYFPSLEVHVSFLSSASFIIGPKRASKIRQMFSLDKTDDVRAYVIKREFKVGEKTRTKSPKIQRLVTPNVLQRKRHRLLSLQTYLSVHASSFDSAALDLPVICHSIFQ